MKISQEEQQKTRKKLLIAAVDIITEKGFKAATMREIARRGGVSDATIYNYFATKEKILTAYFEDMQHQTIQTLKTIEDFHSYTLQEQLQTLIETNLEQFKADREFVTVAFQRAFQTPLVSKSEMATSRSIFIEAVSDMLDAAIEAGEIPEQPYQGMIPELITDLYLGITYYWLKDDSTSFVLTTQLLDKSLNLTVSLLQSGIVAKTLDIASFLFRQHISTYMDNLAPKIIKEKINKRPFMQSTSPNSDAKV